MTETSTLTKKNLIEQFPILKKFRNKLGNKLAKKFIEDSESNKGKRLPLVLNNQDQSSRCMG